MLARLLYLGLALPEESPRSVLLRTVTHNGYRHLHQFARFLGLKSIKPLAIQIGESELVNELRDEAGELKEQFMEMFYRQTKGITNAAPVEIMGTRIPVSALLTTKHKICPECLLDGYMRTIQDVEWVDVCPYHGCRYLTECPECGKPFNWTWMRFEACSCGFEMNYKNVPVIKDDSSGSMALLDRLRKHDSEGVIRIQQILDALRFNEQKEVSARIHLLNQSAMIAINPKNGIQVWLNEKKLNHCGIPDRVLLSRFMVMSDHELRSAAAEILRTCTSELPAKCEGCKCKDESLSVIETETLLGISNQTLLQLARSGKIDRRIIGSRGIEYPFNTICNLYRSFKVEKHLETKQKKAPLYETNRFGLGLGMSIEQLRDGKLLLVEADARKPLSEFVVIKADHDNVERDIIAPRGNITVAETAERLDVYPDAVRRALKAGYITRNSVIGRSNTVFIPIDDVAQFEMEFIFIGKLSKFYRAKKTAFSAQLATAGIYPVSGPGIDAGLVAMYRKSDLSGHDLERIAATEKFQSKAGRKKGGVITYDSSEWMRSSEVGKLLKVSILKLDTIEEYGLLEKGIPFGREAENTRFYKSKSVVATKKWFDSAVSIQQLVKSVNTSVWLFTIRFIQSGFVKSLKINGNAWVSGQDAERVRIHHKEYCTCTEAAKHIGAQQRHFHNMIRLGRILPVTVEESRVNTIILLRWKDVQNKGDWT